MPGQDAPVGGLFGRIAVNQRFVTEVHLNQCLDDQKKFAEQGHNKRIGDLLVEKGYLTEDQRQAIIDMQKKATGPKVYGGFELIEKIAEGGMGAVYRAKQISLDRIVALKLLPEKFAKDETFVARFYREAKVAARLDHPHIVRAVDVGEAEGKHYFAMEFVEGKSLGDMLDEDGMLPESKAVNYILQIAQALEHAWEHQLIHRDIKPDNILIAKEDVAKLADLGLARSTIDESTRVTQTGTAMGTPHYISPEQARGEADIDIRTDIYSLGATLFHLVTGSPPYVGTTAAVIVTKHLTEEPPSARERNPEVSEGLDAVIRKMMAKDKNARYASPTELIRDLEAVAKGGGEGLGMTLMDAGQLDFARAASLAEVEAARRAPTQPTIVRAAPAAWILGAIIGGGVVLTVAVIALVFLLSGPSKERVRAAQSELGAIDALMAQQKWPDAKMRAAAALESFKDVPGLLPEFESRFKTAGLEERTFNELLSKAEWEKKEINRLMESGDWETAQKRATEAAGRFSQLEEMSAEFVSLAAKAGSEAEKEKARQQRTAQAEKAMEEVRRLERAGDLQGAIARAKRLRETYADLPVGRKLDELHHDLQELLRAKYEAAFGRGTKAFMEGRYEEAILYMEEALKLRPDSDAARTARRNAENRLDLGKAKAFITEGDAILHQKDYPGAIAKYEEAIAAFGRLTARGAGADAAQGKGEAVRKHDDAVDLQKCSILLRRARALEAAKDWEGALNAYVDATNLAHGDLVEEVARRKRGAEQEITFLKEMRSANANVAAEKWNAVILACQKALTIKPTSSDAKALLYSARRELNRGKAQQEVNRVSTLIDSRRYEQAIAAAESAANAYIDTVYAGEFRRLAEKARKLRDEAARRGDTAKLSDQMGALRAEIDRLRREKAYKTGAELAAIRQKLGEAEGRLRDLEREARRPVARKEPPAGMSVMGPAGIEFVYVPSGTFAMGSESGDADEKPQQRIMVDGFYVSKFEITNVQYEKYDSSHAQHREKKWSKGDGDPVVYATWYDAGRFCRWLMVKDQEGALYRLPTEAEWECAARGADGRSYPWGNSLKPSDGSAGCNFKDEGRVDRNRFSSPVGSFPSGASPFGCMDMAGNVWEWCLNWYSQDYYYSIPRRNPPGPSAGTEKVVRGGSWNNPLSTCRSSNRAPLKPTIKNANTGFRVVRIEKD